MRPAAPWISLHAHDSRTRLPLHAHDASHLIVVLTGEFADRSGGVTRLCRPSTALLRAPGEEHENVFGGGRATYLRMRVPPQLAASLPTETIACDDVGSRNIERLRRYAHDARSAVDDLLHEILRRIVVEWRVRRARTLIAERCAEAPRIARIADEAGLDPLALVRGFREMYGQTPAQFRMAEQVARACDELRRPAPLPLANVAVLCGFYDQSHMTRAFRRLLRMTPGQFARRS